VPKASSEKQNTVSSIVAYNVKTEDRRLWKGDPLKPAVFELQTK